jgi:hypothetical protein
LAILLAAHRWYLFGGVGGYVEDGEAQVFSLGLATTLKAIFVRLWTGLYVPVNWSEEPGPLLAALCVAGMAASLWLAWRTERPLWPLLAALLVSILPPLHLLSAGPDLAGARLVYLPSIFFCLLLAHGLDGLRGAQRGWIAAALLLFHLAALEHNLRPWIYASERVQAACEAAAAYDRVHVTGLPLRIRGAQAFNNGFPECVVRAAGRPVAVELGPGAGPGFARLRWNSRTDALESAAP